MRTLIPVVLLTLLPLLHGADTDTKYVPELKPLKVNGEAVPAEDVRKLYESLLRIYKGPQKPLSNGLLDKLAEKAREQAIQRVAVRQYLEKNKIAITPEDLKTELEAKKEDLIEQGNSFEKVLKLLNKTEAEFSVEYSPLAALSRDVAAKLDMEQVKAAFEKGREKMPLRHVSQILISDDKAKFAVHPERPQADAQKLAVSIVDRARRGEDFAAMAKELSDDAHTKDSGGDLGFIKPVDPPKELSAAAYTLAKAGDISDPVESELGFHIVKLLERRSDEEAFKKYLRMTVNQKSAELSNTLAKEAKVE